MKISKEVNVLNSIGPPEVLQSPLFLLFLDCCGCHRSFSVPFTFIERGGEMRKVKWCLLWLKGKFILLYY